MLRMIVRWMLGGILGSVTGGVLGKLGNELAGRFDNIIIKTIIRIGTFLGIFVASCSLAGVVVKIEDALFGVGDYLEY